MKSTNIFYIFSRTIKRFTLLTVIWAVETMRILFILCSFSHCCCSFILVLFDHLFIKLRPLIFFPLWDQKLWTTNPILNHVTLPQKLLLADCLKQLLDYRLCTHYIIILIDRFLLFCEKWLLFDCNFHRPIQLWKRCLTDDWNIEDNQYQYTQ